MPMKPEGRYPKTRALSESEIMDMYNGAYEPKDSND